jgi:hypothetical protein
MNSHNDDNDMNSSDYKNSYIPHYIFIPDEELDGLTNIHNKLNILDNMHEYLNDSHRKIAFDNDEDTGS